MMIIDHYHILHQYNTTLLPSVLQFKMSRMCFVILIINGLTPNYLLDLVPPIIQETTNYNLRNANDIQTLHARTNLYYNSFFPSTIRAWNSLPEDTKQSPSISFFKFRLNRDINKPPKYYSTGTRMGQILHTRIRLECSSLNAHLYRKNIVPEPTCQCGGFESSYHFFFICPIFVDARTRYLPANLNNLTTRDICTVWKTKQTTKTRHYL